MAILSLTVGMYRGLGHCNRIWGFVRISLGRDYNSGQLGFNNDLQGLVEKVCILVMLQ